MKIPDETKYRKNQKRIEDTHGWVLCTHCRNCALVHNYQIHTDGFFFCFHHGVWRDGDELLEYMCDGYVQKRCSNCWNKYKCSDRSSSISFCNRFLCMPKDKAMASISGRRRPLRTDRVAAIQAEQMYIDIKTEAYGKNVKPEESELISNNQIH